MMRAARMHAYDQPLVLEDVPVPDIAPDEVLLKVTAAGMCRTDVQLVDAREFTYHGSFWGNFNDLSEVIAMAQQGRIRHAAKIIRFEDINENLDLLRTGDVVGRAVVKY